MKRHISLIFTVLFIFIVSASSAFAQSDASVESASDIRISQLNFDKIDPVKELESLKSKVHEDYKQGRLSKEEYKQHLSKIDFKLKSVKEFNKLSLEEKKERLVTDFKKALNKKVQEGKIAAEDIDAIVGQFTDKINQWDGQGFPAFYHRELMIAKKGHTHNKMDKAMHEKCMHHMHMKFVEALDKAVKDKVINKEQKEQILKYLHDLMKEMK